MSETRLEEVEMLLEEGFEGVYAISLVDKPAIESDFIYLSTEKVLLKVIDEEKRIVTGAVLIPELRVKRKHPKTGEPYNIFFTKETILALSQKFMKDHNQSNITLEHTKNAKNIDVVESWIKEDDSADKSVMLGLDVPVGSWIVTAKISDDTIWNEQIKKGLLSGFSIEANMARSVNFKSIEDMESKSILDKIKALLTSKEPEATEEVVEAAEVKEEKVEAEEAPAGEVPTEGEATEPAPEEEEEKTYVSVEEFQALEAKYLEQAQALEAIVDYLGDGFTKPEEAPVEEAPAEMVEQSTEEPKEEEVKASEVKEEKEEEENVEFVALPKESKDKPFQLKKFDRNLTVAERIALNFKN